MHQFASDASRALIEKAEVLAATYVDRTHPRAVLLTGSAAEGVSDFFSDLDLIVYHDLLPDVNRLESARDANQATQWRIMSGREGELIVEEYVLDDVECQVMHTTVAAWERNMASVLENNDPTTRIQKVIMGLLDGTALHGSDIIDHWKARAEVYPEGLARAMVEHHLHFFPLWLASERWKPRDATIFHHQMLAETSLNILGVLAGLNRLYCSTFQFKQLRGFLDVMRIAPERLADRLDSLFTLDPVEAGDALERLVDETVSLVEAHMPEIDTVEARRHIGVRQRPWKARPALDTELP